MNMKTVRVSPEYQVVIPRSVRDALRITPGSRFHVVHYENRIEFIPVQNIRRLRGFLKGVDTSVAREPDCT